MNVLTLVHSTPPAPQVPGFTTRDLMALTRWMQQSEHHGYRRVLIEGGTVDGGPDDGGYVLFYAAGSDWASFGMVRQEDDIVIWHCGTGADLGRFPTMPQALGSLPSTKPFNKSSRDCAKPSPARPRLMLVHNADLGAFFGG